MGVSKISTTRAFVYQISKDEQVGLEEVMEVDGWGVRRGALARGRR